MPSCNVVGRVSGEKSYECYFATPHALKNLSSRKRIFTPKLFNKNKHERSNENPTIAYQDKTVLTIITITKNNANDLRETISSFLMQTDKDFDVILVNGGSKIEWTDFGIESLRITELCDDGHGIYSAMNLGLDHVKEGNVIFINAGDMLANQHVIENLRKTNAAKRVITGGTEVIGERYQWTLSSARRCHNSMIFPKSNIRYDLNLKIFSDSKYISENIDYFGEQEVEYVISKFMLGGVSNKTNWRLIAASFRERGWGFGLLEVVKGIMIFFLGETARYVIYLLKGVKGERKSSA